MLLADQLIAQLEAERLKDKPCVSRKQLQYMAASIEEMRNRVRENNLPPRQSRYRNLTRLILDQWPLNHPLGNQISELEDTYIGL